ncbi:MAG: hypothetical protein ACRCZP_11520 [Phycicoccus sp.]
MPTPNHHASLSQIADCLGTPLHDARPANPSRQVTVERLIDGADHNVEVQLPGRTLLRQLLEAARQHPLLRHIIVDALYGDGVNPDRLIMSRSDVDTHDAFALVLTAGDAERLAGDLDEATVRPDWCLWDGCPNLAVGPMWCAAHEDTGYEGGDAA